MPVWAFSPGGVWTRRPRGNVPWGLRRHHRYSDYGLGFPDAPWDSGGFGEAGRITVVQCSTLRPMTQPTMPSSIRILSGEADSPAKTMA